MRYQLYQYVNGRSQSLKGKIVNVPDRPAAIRAARDLYGVASGGARALDVDCTFCEDQPVGNAGRWADPDAPLYAPCPRCGKTHNPDERK